MVPPLCYKHNDIHSELINALRFSRALKNNFPPRPPARRGSFDLFTPQLVTGRWAKQNERQWVGGTEGMPAVVFRGEMPFCLFEGTMQSYRIVRAGKDLEYDG